jgi:hypothetical protein
MMDHVIEFLGPYLDGELRNLQVLRLEKHLESCKMCRSELHNLRVLQDLLSEDAELPTMKSEDQFVAEVSLLMDRNTEPTAIKKMLLIGWKAIPVTLAGAWLFMQTALALTATIFVLSRLTPELPVVAQFKPNPAVSYLSNALCCFTQPIITQVLEFITQVIRPDIDLNWQIPAITLLPLIVGILYVCWLASWWVMRNRQNPIEKNKV